MPRCSLLSIVTLLMVAGATLLVSCSSDEGAERPVPTSTPTAAPSIPKANSPSLPIPTAEVTVRVAHTPTPTPRLGPARGVSLSPKSLGSPDFPDFFPLAKEAGDLVRWAGSWEELANTSGAPAVIAQLNSASGLRTVIDTGVFATSQKRLFRPLDQPAQDFYVQAARAFAARHKPDYLGIGVEINAHWEAEPKSFQTFVGLFSRTYDAVKVASPNTKVYTVFQLERLRGLKGGLFGGVNDPSEAEWDLIGLFPKADLVGFTTYPGLIYRDPSDIPPDYYAEISRHTDKPIAFVEVGWSASDAIPGWESSETEQAAFVERFFELTAGLSPETAIWLHLYEQPANAPAFKGMGMVRDDGSKRPAWEAWTKPR